MTARLTLARFSPALLVTLLALPSCKDDPLRVGGLCQSAAECPPGQLCVDGHCTATCTTDADCIAAGLGVFCQDAACVGLLRADPLAPASTGEGTTVELDASPTYVGQGTVTGAWQQLAGPPVTLSPPDALVVTFTAPTVFADTVLSFHVEVTDGAETQGADLEVLVTNDVNEPPVAALAGPPGPVVAGSAVALDAGGSADPNPGDSLQYTWLPAELVDAKGATATFHAPLDPDIYEVQVVVSDGTDTDTASLAITVTAPDAGCDGPADCDDGDPCTTDACTDGTCAHGDACDDGDPCTTDGCGPDGCSHAPLPCDDGDPCTDDACDPASGCVHAPTAAPCDDGDPCTTGDACQATGCVGGAPLLCDDGDPCTTDACTPGVGCTTTPVACDDGNGCTADGCDPAEGCTYAWVENGTPCGAGDPCSSKDFCDDGECIAQDLCAGSCCVPKAAPFCADPAVVACVCAADPFCCEESWDGLCAEEADACGACDGPCCSPNPTAGCAAESVESCVCLELGSAHCCDVAWDASCVEAAKKCGHCAPGGTGCQPAPAGTEGCGGCPCQGCVCANDPACCTTLWDAACVALCEDPCGADCDGSGGWGCAATYQPGCGGCACEECVCALYPECCSDGWHEKCAAACWTTCGAECPSFL